MSDPPLCLGELRGHLDRFHQPHPQPSPASSWDPITRSCWALLHQQGNPLPGGLELSLEDGAMVRPQRPLAATVEVSGQQLVWGRLAAIHIENGNLVGRVEVSGHPEGEAIALPVLANGTARFALSLRLLAVEEHQDGRRIATSWEPRSLALVLEAPDLGPTLGR